MLVTALRCDGIDCTHSIPVPRTNRINLPNGWFAISKRATGLFISRTTTTPRDNHYCGITCCNKAVASQLGE